MSAHWRTIGDKKCYYRSLWEARYAAYLQFMKEHNSIKDWEYEPQTFWFEEIKRGVRSYLPDFKVIDFDDSHHWIEVKGWMSPKCKTKIKRFKKYYPKEKLILVEKNWFIKNSKKLNWLWKEWG